MFLSPISGTGEHGVGIGKKEYLVEELGEGTVQLMKTIKKAIDPLGIFNPGKVCAILKIPLFFFVHQLFDSSIQTTCRRRGMIKRFGKDVLCGCRRVVYSGNIETMLSL